MYNKKHILSALVIQARRMNVRVVVCSSVNHGKYSPKERKIAISSRQPECMQILILAHELGHVDQKIQSTVEDIITKNLFSIITKNWYAGEVEAWENAEELLKQTSYNAWHFFFEQKKKALNLYKKYMKY